MRLVMALLRFVLAVVSPESADSAKENVIQGEKTDEPLPQNQPVTSAKKDVISKKNVSSQEGVLRMKLVGIVFFLYINLRLYLILITRVNFS